jgi:hypothetical protein
MKFGTWWRKLAQACVRGSRLGGDYFICLWKLIVEEGGIGR